jgi:hypothetical protein
VFDAGLNDDNFDLIYEANKEVNMAVNTPIQNCALQGDTWGSILASDTIGQGYLKSLRLFSKKTASFLDVKSFVCVSKT